MNEDTYLSDEEELECPLCMEEFDISDRTFKPCPCGYQICRFCYNRIVNSETANGCPACRRQYTEETVEFKPLSAEEWKRDQQRIHSRKLKEKEKRESEMASRRHLSNMRVVQKNLVYVIGFSPKSADADLAATLRGNDYFAQYGKINKIVVNKKSHPNGQPTVGVYITYARKEDAARAVQAVDNTINDGRVLRASFGTTKYCSAYLRQQVCQNPNCMYLHEPGEDLDSYTREDMSTIQHAAKAAEGMHANALAAHHMRRQPSRADSTNTANPEDSAQAVALPATVSWASSPKPSEIIAQEAGPISQQRVENGKPDSLPPASRDSKVNQAEIPPPPSQAAQTTVNPADVLTPSLQPALDHPILGPTLKILFEGRFNFKFVPRVMPGLSEADIKAAENFPSLFSWNPQPRRPTSPNKANKNHTRSGSRYAFAADSKTPPPGFVPPGLATGLQPPGFSAGAQQSQSKEGTTAFFSQFLRNASSENSAGQSQTAFEDPAILGLRESVKSPTDVVLNSSTSNKAATSTLAASTIQPPLKSSTVQDPSLTEFASLQGHSDKAPTSVSGGLDSLLLADQQGSPINERSQSKFGATFAKLENLEAQAQHITQDIDHQVRGSWQPTSRPRDSNSVAMSTSATNEPRILSGPQPNITLTKSSGTWQPSPPPPRVSPSPKPIVTTATAKAVPSFRNASRIPWEPSPPPTTNRPSSPVKAPQVAKPTEQPMPGNVSTANDRLSIQNPIPRVAEQKQSILDDGDFPNLKSAMQVEAQTNAVPTTHTPTKKMWNTIPPVTAVPIPGQTTKPVRTLDRRDSVQSVVSIGQERTRSRQNSNAEAPNSKVTTPTRGLSPATSPLSSRAASPIPLNTPTLTRSLSTLGTTPAISSPLASNKVAKQIRIVSSKAVEDSKAKADKAAAEERAIQKIKEEEVAAAAKSMIRKSVPASSIKKSKEQKLAEQREKAERRELESLASSHAEEANEPTEIAPIIGRARKQKNKQGLPKTPVKVPAKPMTETEPENENEPAIESEEAEPEVPVTDNKQAASDAISELSREMDLRNSKFFMPIPGLNFNYELTKEELAAAAELTQWPAYRGKETIEQLEVMLSQARKEAGETMKALEKLQRRNIKLARLDVPIST